MADFRGVDFLLLDELLSEEEILARKTVREFVSREFLPRVQEHVRRDGSIGRSSTSPVRFADRIPLAIDPSAPVADAKDISSRSTPTWRDITARTSRSRAGSSSR